MPDLVPKPSEELRERDSIEPPEELLTTLDARLLASLGGRLNRHWIVEAATRERWVLRQWSPQPVSSIAYERALMVRLQHMGWPVALLGEPVEFDGLLWSIAPFLPGQPKPVPDSTELRSRGRLLAELHSATSRIESLDQRPGWRRAEEILSDPELDRILSESEATRTEEVGIVRWHLNRARLRIGDLNLENRSSIPIHGDFAKWNLLFQDGKLSGLLDFELAHNDHRVGDFALSWRGKYDEVIEGYEEVSPLEEEERAAIVPVWWAYLIEGACLHMRRGTADDGWTLAKLLARSPAMGPDAKEMPLGVDR